MNLHKLAEHTVDLDQLPESPIVLDVGCRWFDFSKAVLEARPKAEIIAMDPGPGIEDPQIPGVTFLNLALVADSQREMEYEDYFTGIGNFIREHGSPYLHQLAEGYTAKGEGRRVTVQCCNIRDVMAACRKCMDLTHSLRPQLDIRERHDYSATRHFDLIKLDCEASEFPILENWPGPIATQISVEFHDYVHKSKWDAAYFARLFESLGRFGYRVIQHEEFELGGGWGHWDSLLAL
jgi:hypothetical protein